MEDSLWSLIPINTLFRASSLDGAALYGVRIQENGRQFAAWIGDMACDHSYHSVMENWKSWAERRDEERIFPVAILAKDITGEETGPEFKALVEKHDAELDAKMTPEALAELKAELIQSIAEFEDKLRRAEGELPELIAMTLAVTELHGGVAILESGNRTEIRDLISSAKLSLPQ